MVAEKDARERVIVRFHSRLHQQIEGDERKASQHSSVFSGEINRTYITTQLDSEMGWKVFSKLVVQPWVLNC